MILFWFHRYESHQALTGLIGYFSTLLDGFHGIGYDAAKISKYIKSTLIV